MKATGNYSTRREEMKYENQRNILNLINKAHISRAQIAAETGLTQASVSMIVNELIEKGIVVETTKSPDESCLGRRPICLDINPNWGYIIGISIDRDGIDVGLVDIKGNVLDKFDRFPTTGNYTACLDLIAEKASALLRRNSNAREKLLAVGIAVPGPFDPQTGKLLNPPGFFEEWYNLELKAEVENRFPYPVYIAHNGIAFAMAEKNIGIGTEFSNFLLLNINAGLGAGLVLNGSIHSNSTGFSCEIGHTSIDINGRLCSCGHRGCLETYASLSAIMHDARRLRPELDSWESLVDAAYRDDSLCLRFLSLEADYLSQAIINTHNLLGLEAVILTGKISYRPELLLNNIQQKVNSVILSKAYHPIQILSSGIHESVHIISGAAVVINEIFNGQLYFYHSKRQSAQ